MAKKKSDPWILFSETHWFERFLEHESFQYRRMFGCLAIYLHGRMKAVLAQNKEDRSYRGKKYKFLIWDGVLFPTDRSHHASIQKDWPELINHPVLPKWLYLPSSSSRYEEVMSDIIEKIAQNDIRFGIDDRRRLS